MSLTKLSRTELLVKENFDEILKEIRDLRLNSNIKESYDLISRVEPLLLPETDEHLLAVIHTEKGLNLYFDLNFDKAIELTLSSLNTFRKYKDNLYISICFNNLGVFYSALGLNVKALDHFLESIRYNEDNLPALNNAGNKYLNIGEYDNAIELLERAIVKAKEQENTQILIETNTDLAELYIKKNNPEQALEILSRSEIRFRKAKDARERHFHLLAKGKAFLCLNKPEEALKLFLEAYEIAKSKNYKELLWFSYKRLISAFEKLKDYEKLSQFYKKSLDLQEKIYDEQMTKRISTIEEVYEVEKREFQFKQMLEKNARLASIGVMAAGITHEINQPLNAIVINSDGLLYKDNRDKVLPKDYRNSIEQILKAASRIDDIIKHMRSFWAAPNYIQFQEIELHEVIEYALSLVNMQVQSHGIILRKDFCKGNPRIKANKTLLEQILINMVNNSIHSLDNKSSKSKNISISTELKKPYVILRIEDDGSGIELENSERIFDPFFSTKSPGEGMGLGLAIVKSFIKEIKGEIMLVPKEEPGALFEILLPISNENDI